METLTCKKEDGVALITFSRPQVMNIINMTKWAEISQIMDEMEKDDEVKAVVFIGANEKAFIAGSNIKEMKDRDSISILDFVNAGKEAINKIENLSKPTIAAIAGYALGGGCEIALACDIRIAADNAKMGLPEINLGIIPGSGGTQRLTRLVGMAKAKELIFTGKLIDAQTALNIGLVNNVVPVDSLLDEAMSLGRKFASVGGFALKMAKTAINKGLNMSLEEALIHEIHCFALCFSTWEQKEGMSAFLEKRKPKFQNK